MLIKMVLCMSVTMLIERAKRAHSLFMSIEISDIYIVLILYLVTCDESDWSKSVGYMATYIPTLFIAHGVSIV